MIRTQSFAGEVTEANAAAAAAEASATAAALSETAAETAEANAEIAAAAAVNLALLTDDFPGVDGPDLRLLDEVYGTVWTARTEQDRVDVLYARSSLSTTFDDFPGVAARDGVVLDAVGGELASPAVVRESAGNLSYARDDVTKASVLRASRGQLWGVEGQSLAIFGGTYTPSLINSTVLYPDNVFKPSTGMWTNGRTWTAAAGAVDEYYGGLNVCLGSDPTGADAAIPVSFWNKLYEQILAATGEAAVIAGYVEGAGGASIQNLGPGSDPFENSIRNMQRYRDWGISEGIDFYMPGLRWIHGNEDLLTMSGEQYIAWLITHQQRKTEAARRIFGQPEEVVYYIEQNTGSSTGFATMYQVVDAQREICRRMPDKFRMLPPSYDLLHPDSIHMDTPNYHLREQRQAICVFQDYFCGGRPPFQVVDAWWTGATTLRMEVYIPTQPLVLDTTGAVITTTGLDWSHGANGYGLEFDDGSGSSPYVSSIAVVNEGQEATATMTIASPCVVTEAAHGLSEGTPIFFTTTGALPTGVTTSAAYFVKSPATNTFNLAATPGGTAINTSGSQSGTHTLNVSTHRSYIDVTLSGTASRTYRSRVMIAARAAPAAAQGPVAGARSCFRDSTPGVSTIDREGDTADYPLYLWLSRQSVTVR